MNYLLKILGATLLLAGYLAINGYTGITTCVDKENGNYPTAQYDEHYYATCENGTMYDGRPCPSGLVFKAALKVCGVEGSVEVPVSNETGHWIPIYNGHSTPQYYKCVYVWYRSLCSVGDTRTY